KNVALENVQIGGTGDFVAGLVNVNEGQVLNCRVEGAILEDNTNVGLLVGTNYGTVEDCNSVGELWGKAYVGGMVYFNESGGEIINCVSHVEMNAMPEDHNFGGLASYNVGRIFNCRVFGNINSFGSGDISADSKINGGICSDNRGIIQYCHFAGHIRGTGVLGGIAAHNLTIGGVGGIIEYCSAEGSLGASDEVNYGLYGWRISYIGGLVGQSQGGEVHNSGFTGSLEGEAEVGGLLGWAVNTLVENCYANATLTVGPRTLVVYEIGGLAGGLAGGSVVRDCYTMVPIINSPNGASQDGEFVGWVNATGVEFLGCVCLADSQLFNIGYQDGLSKDIPEIYQATEAEMKLKNTYLTLDWDFWGESDNGNEDHWRICEDGVNYPSHSWNGVFGCGSVELPELVRFRLSWLSRMGDANWYPECDLERDGVIDLRDYARLCIFWMR
ncbi:MAG: hypothetical protein GY869_29000, partial [Planctomycetes bacterium]|nr:hypothetical protein [Planctomycetota bacterium]